MVNKKGFIRTLEAVIAIVLLLAVIYAIYPKQDLSFTKPQIIKQSQNTILSEVSINQTFRECLSQSQDGALNDAEGNYHGSIITEPCLTDLNNFIEIYKPKNFIYLAEICSQAKSCLNQNLPIEKSVYAESIMLVSGSPKVFRIYFWER